MTKVNIKSVQENRDGSIEVLPQSTEVEIMPVRPSQFGKLMKVVNATQKDLQSNEQFKETVTKLFGEYAEGFDFEDLFRNEDFNVFSILDALGFVAEEVPDRLTEIIEVTSGINRVLIENQDMDTYFDIIEQVIEVNDIEKIVERIKRLSSKMGKALNFLQANQDQVANAQSKAN